MIDSIGKTRMALAVALVALCGCGGPATPPPGSQPLENATVRPASATGAPTAPGTAEPADASSETPAAEPTVSEEAAPATTANAQAGTFTPPYPERTDLFKPPRINEVPRPAAGEGESSDSNIQLLGFIGTDDRRAILSCNGQVQTLQPGSEIAGVELVAMTENEVTLRRGRVQWQLSLLEN